MKAIGDRFKELSQANKISSFRLKENVTNNTVFHARTSQDNLFMRTRAGKVA